MVVQVSNVIYIIIWYNYYYLSYNANDDDRLMKLLDSTEIEANILYHICQELSTRQITPPPSLLGKRGGSSSSNTYTDTADHPTSDVTTNKHYTEIPQQQLQHQRIIFQATTALSKSKPLTPQEGR